MKRNVINDHASLLTAGSISRRKFIMTALAAGATLPMALSMAGQAMAATPLALMASACPTKPGK